MRNGILIAVMAFVNILLRFLPFLLFRRETPSYISYLGRVLPAAIIGMLVVYCLKDVSLLASPHGLPEFMAVAFVVVAQVVKRNALLSILAGTLVYMVLIQVVF